MSTCTWAVCTFRLAIGKVTYRGGAVGVGGVSWTAGGGRGQLGVAEGCQGAGWGGYQGD